MIKGIYSPIVTIFGNDGKPDFEANGRLIERLIGKGITGILFLGSIGEFFTLSVPDKKNYIQFVVQKVAKRAVVMIGTGGTSVDEAVELTRFSEQAGADVAVAISPYYMKLDEASLYRYYAEVAGSVRMPILIYNFPDRTAVNLSPDLILRLAQEFPNIVGIKDTVDSISHTRKIIDLVKPQRPDFRIFSGYDEYLAANLLAGGDGVISGLTNIAPEILLDLFAAFERQDLAALSELQKKVDILMRLYDASESFIAAIKGAVAVMVEGINPVVGKPACSVTDQQLAVIRQILAQAGLKTT